MERGVRNLRYGVVALAVLFSISLVANGLLIWRMQRTTTPLQGIIRLASKAKNDFAKTKPFTTEYVEGMSGIAQELLMNQELVQFAGSEKFSNASSEERTALIRHWCEQNLPHQFTALDSKERSKLVDDVKSGLEDLLSEKEFRV